ncbi:glycoside hydrolase family 95-like protein [Halomontanus rarus]|uniref:glycoside hydrolase family 95-like protein n=1 Tax=Halomontanus rarus TaxID=3034020 RepID=UPI001A986D9A
MLLQSQSGDIVPLPALPDAWADGAVSGLRARGGFEVDMSWRDGELEEMTIESLAGVRCRVRIDETADVALNGEPVDADRSESGSVAVDTDRGDTLTLTM